jgi:hypothetical protein
VRESPSGQPNPSGSVLFDNFTVGNGGVRSITVSNPTVKVGDTLAYSANNTMGPLSVVLFILTDGNVTIQLNNMSLGPFTVNATRVYFEVLRAG